MAIAGHGARTFSVYRSTIGFDAGPRIGERLTPEDAATWLAGDVNRRWVLLFQDDAVDPGAVLIGTLEAAGGIRVEMLYSRELRLFAYQLPPDARITPLAPEDPMDEVFGQDVALRGWRHGQEDRLLVVYLFWELLAPQAETQIGAVHLVTQPGERPIAQRDKPVLSDHWRLPNLPVGELLPDRYELILPSDLAAGEYALFALLYNPASGERRLLATGEDMAFLGWISLQ